MLNGGMLKKASNISTIVARDEVMADKSLGQNFLRDRHILDLLLQGAQLTSDDIVVEIGPGQGVITKHLAPRVKHVYAVELDPDMIARAKAATEHYTNITFLHQDILTFDPTKPPLNHGPYKVIGAIPYNITSPIIHLFLTTKHRPSSLTLIVQKEVAEKMVAQPPHASYLSMFIQSSAKAVILKNNIAPEVFTPPPKVKSAIIHITCEANDIPAKAFSDFLHQGFKHPRKMLHAVFDRELLHTAGISSSQRPSEVTLDQWIRLFEVVRK